MISRCCRILEVQIYELNGHGSHAQDTDGHEHHGGGEHPLAAQSWSQTQLGKMAQKCGGRFTVYGCCHGMFHQPSKKLLRKPWGWFTTKRLVRDALESRCHHPPEMHRKIEGAITPTTATYPVILCRRFAKAILKSEVSDNMFHSILASEQVANQEIAAGSDAGEQGHDH